jgi:hypothetical protein
MRLSCNGCRVLRKGCSEDCSIRPCLQWIKSPEAQANATVFLAKFYGRAGLMNLVNAAPADAHRPGIFRSLLYEACGRIVNPIYGSVGLLWSNNWHMCQAAVEAVLAGKPIVQVSSEDAAAADRTPPLRAYDIRHVSKLDDGLHKVAKAGRTRFKRASSASSNHKPSKPRAPEVEEPDRHEHHEQEEDVEFQRAPSHGSSGSHDDDDERVGGVPELAPQCQDEASVDTDAEAGSHVSQAEHQSAAPAPAAENAEEVEKEEQLGLELTLGFAPVAARLAGCRPSGWSGAGEPEFLGLRFL